MPRFRKKPVVVEAVQWFPGVEHPGVEKDEVASVVRDIPAYRVLTIHDQWVYLTPGDWILPEPKPGRYYPVKPAVFAATYDPIATDDTPRHVDEIEARVRPTICQTFSSQGRATVEGRITEDDFDFLLTAARSRV